MASQALTLEQVRTLAPSAFATHEHDSRSARYAYIPTSDIITKLMDEGFMPFSAKQSVSRYDDRREFTKHMLTFRQVADMQRAAVVGEQVPEVIVINSHDGSSAFNIMAGIFRFVCSNGMVVADSTIGSVKVLHKGNIAEQVVGASYRVISDSRRVMDKIGTWSGLMLTNGEQNALAEAARVLRFGEDEGKVVTPITAGQLLEPRRVEDNKSDLWHTFNRLQENTTKGGLRGRTAMHRDDNGVMQRGRRMTTRPVKGIDQDVKLNRALWTLAEELAKAKR